MTQETNINDIKEAQNIKGFDEIFSETLKLFKYPIFYPNIHDVTRNDFKEKIKIIDKNNTELLIEFLRQHYSRSDEEMPKVIGDGETEYQQKIGYFKDDDVIPYFIKTCYKDDSNDDSNCYKNIASTIKKFSTNHTSSNDDHDILIRTDVDIFKWGIEGQYIGDSAKRNRKMNYSYNKETKIIEIKTINNDQITREMSSGPIDYDDLINDEKTNDEIIKFHNNGLIILDKRKWKLDRNIKMRIRNDDEIAKFQTFLNTVKYHLIEEDKAKIIAADVIRSTMICPKNSFVNDVNTFLLFIKNNGGIVGKINNTFEEAKKQKGLYIPYFFYGLNITFFVKQTETEPSDTQNKYIAFEVQFHTERTFEIKTDQHDDYDLQKSFDEIFKSEIVESPDKQTSEDGGDDDEVADKYKEFFKMCKKNYDDFMSLYNTDRERNIDDFFLNAELHGMGHEDELLYIQNFIHEQLVSNKDIIYYELKNKDDIFHEKNNKFIDILVDQDRMKDTFVDQFRLMKELFILCRCIKNYNLIYKEKDKSYINVRKQTLNTDLVKEYNCYNYYESKLLFLEKKYKNPTFDVSRRKKYEDFFVKSNKSQTIVIHPLDELMQGSYIKKINSKFLIILCKFLDINHSRKNKKDNIKLITEEFKRVMNNNIGSFPFC